jgi:PBP1b-binding outer membrane lipoprotein LpoB
MKKLLLTLSLTFILALVLAGCSASEEDTTGAVDETGLQEEVPAAVLVPDVPQEKIEELWNVLLAPPACWL